jgi:hypothetical protein
MWDRETWRFINSFAPWLSAIGTLSAVVVSLYMALRSSRLKFRVSAAISFLVPSGQVIASSPQYLTLKVTNQGFRDGMIQGIAWRPTGIRRKAFVVIPPVDPFSTKLPSKLSYGEFAQFLFPISRFDTDAIDLLKWINRWWFPSVAARSLKFGVYTTTGQEFYVRLDRSLREWILERAKSVSDGTK